MDHQPEFVAPLLDRFLNIKQVAALIGAAPSSIYAWIRLGLFPVPKRIGVRRTGWPASEIAQWVRDRPST